MDDSLLNWCIAKNRYLYPKLSWFYFFSQFNIAILYPMCASSGSALSIFILTGVVGPVDPKEISRLQSTSMVKRFLKRRDFGPNQALYQPGQAKLGSGISDMVFCHWEIHSANWVNQLEKKGTNIGKPQVFEAHLNDLRFQWKFLNKTEAIPIGIIPWLLTNFCTEFHIQWCHHNQMPFFQLWLSNLFGRETSWMFTDKCSRESTDQIGGTEWDSRICGSWRYEKKVNWGLIWRCCCWWW